MDDRRKRKLSEARQALAFWAPGLIAFTFVLMGSGSFTDRLMMAAVAGMAVQTAGLVGMVLTHMLARWLLGKGDDPADALAPERLLAGVLLAPFVWMWWQYDRDRVVARVAVCVEELEKEGAGYGARDAVMHCYEHPRDDGRYDFE